MKNEQNGMSAELRRLNATKVSEIRKLLQGFCLWMAADESCIIYNLAHSFAASLQDQSAAYGQNMPQFLKSLERNHRSFSTPPVGPLGMFVKVKDEYQKYTECIETALGKRPPNSLR